MPVISSSVPNLINGISQQNPTQRNLTQGEAQINAQSSLKESETNYFNAVYDMLVYKIDYLKATGSLVK